MHKELTDEDLVALGEYLQETDIVVYYDQLSR